MIIIDEYKIRREKYKQRIKAKIDNIKNTISDKCRIIFNISFVDKIFLKKRLENNLQIKIKQVLVDENILNDKTRIHISQSHRSSNLYIEDCINIKITEK
jgi:hypothetical protein